MKKMNGRNGSVAEQDFDDSCILIDNMNVDVEDNERVKNVIEQYVVKQKVVIYSHQSVIF